MTGPTTGAKTLVLAVAAGLGALPLALGSPLPALPRGLLAVALAAAAVATVLADRLRTPTAVALAGWLGSCVVVAEGGAALAAVLGGVLLRVWCGLPELMVLGRGALPDLLPELLAGAAAAGLVVAVADRRSGLPPEVLVLGVAALGCLVATTLVRVRR